MLRKKIQRGPLRLGRIRPARTHAFNQSRSIVLPGIPVVHPIENVISPSDVTRTVYHAMGVNDLIAEDRFGRPFNLLDEGRALTELF